MVKNSLLILFLFLCGCGTMEAAKAPIVDSEFIEYLNKYRDYKYEYTDSDSTLPINIIFRSQDWPVIGRCIVWSNGKRIIEIDPFFWVFADVSDRDVLFYHEMGHCDLDRDHTTDKSLMKAHHIGGHNFLQDKSFYMQELFQENGVKSLAIIHTMSYSDLGGTHGKGINDSCRSHRIR